MLNAVPVFGWLLSAVFAVSMAIPFYFIWNSLAPVYFYFLPTVYQQVPFWDCVGLFIILPIIKHMLTPKFVSVSGSSKGKDD